MSHEVRSYIHKHSHTPHANTLLFCRCLFDAGIQASINAYGQGSGVFDFILGVTLVNWRSLFHGVVGHRAVIFLRGFRPCTSGWVSQSLAMRQNVEFALVSEVHIICFPTNICSCLHRNGMGLGYEVRSVGKLSARPVNRDIHGNFGVGLHLGEMHVVRLTDRVLWTFILYRIGATIEHRVPHRVVYFPIIQSMNPPINDNHPTNQQTYQYISRINLSPLSVYNQPTY